MSSEIQNDLLNELNNEVKIARVIGGLLNDEALDWCSQEIKTLDNLIPKDCLLDESLRRRLKTVLMRMPC